ncbi:MAG: TatD family hydrolase [Actinomycetota bacterium]|nr:TatD family hydrolase [Acidimicrobiia bacterium]MDQ3469958.1 TatD family hydrolase [Actinomycetota bacterium]
MPSPAGWVDSHCHLPTETPEATAEVVADAVAAGVTTLVTVGCDRETSLAGLAVAAHHSQVHATVGLHPHEARHGVETIADLFGAGAAAGAAPIAVGECGLDYHYDHSPRDQQREAFAAQIGIANRLGLPLVIHTRSAWDDTFAILDAEGVPQRTVFHCFTGGPEEAAQCLARGAFVSFSGIVTFKGAAQVAAAAAVVPLTRTLVETDSPYLAPVPNRGRPNRPAWVTHVGARLAEIHGVAPGVVRDATGEAARLAFPAIAAP